MRRIRPTAAAVALAAAVAAGPAALGQTSLTVTSEATGGTRTLNVKSLSGGSLDTISLGTVGSAGFLSNVADVKYSRAGYQVTASMSNLYAYSAGEYDCSEQIDSADFSLDFLVNPVSLTDVAALPEPTWDLSGTLPDPLATLLGVAAGTAVTVQNAAGEAIDRNLSGVFTGVENSLPIQVSAGAGGAFTNPGPHADCDPSPANAATSLSLMDGQVNNLADVFTWVTGEITAAADENTNGAITATELVNTGEVTDATMAEAVRQGLADAGVDLGTLDTLVNAGTISMQDIYNQLIAALDAVSSLLGQTGTYLSLPKLSVNVAGGTPAGTYRGTMTVTMVDV